MKPFIIYAQTLDSYSVLPRIALYFSRRRLRIDRLEMHADEDDRAMRFRIELRCDGATIERLVKQLRRIVELEDIVAREKTAVREAA